MSYPLGTNESEIVVQQTSNSQFDMKKFAYKAIGMLPWIVLGLIISITTGNLYLRYTPSQHKIAAYILVKKEEEATIDYKVLKGLGVEQASSDVLNQIDILKSYTLLERVVDSLKLNIHVRQEGRVTKNQIYGDDVPFTFKVAQLNEHSWPASYHLTLDRDGLTISGKGGKHSYKYGDSVEVEYGKLIFERNPEVKINPKGYILDFTTRHQEAGNLRGAMSVELTNDKGGNILEISMMDEIPERAVEILNELIDVFNSADLEDKNIVTNKTIKFLSDRVDSVSKELGQIESIAENFKRNNRITDVAIQGSVFQNEAVSVDNERVKQYSQYKILDALENFINNFKNTNEIIPSTMGVGESALQALILKHNDLVIEKQALEKRSLPTDPHLIDASKQIYDIRDNILRNIRLLKKAFEQTVNDLEASYNSLESRIGGLPEKERILQNLKRLASVKEQLYLFLLQKKEEAQLSLASNITNTRVIDYATDLGSKSPNRTQIKLLAFLVGLVVPIGLLLLKDFFNNKVVDKKEIESATTLPIVGELSQQKKKRGAIVDTLARSALAEQFRLLRTNLYYAVPDRKLKTIMLSSFISGEGKSFVALNLANALAVTGAKTVLVEFDLRNPRLSKVLGISNDKGVSGYISGNDTIEEVIRTIPEANNISVITSGPIPANPAEALLGWKTSLLFDYLKNNYDYIIIDTAPIGLVTDALLLEKHTDLTLFVIRHRVTLKAILPYIDKLNRDKKFRNMGVVVNGIKKDGSYGYSFGFGYSYNNYLNEKRKNIISRFFSFLRKES
ncbi:MAG: polysaccharide biosynthesis tyrosine autokinase [Bacteroidota bacterium]|nr:polysaccharide biosynthesis tyrosine autokinase [Bacteroidota bacterium]